jgi:hypothetical protein
MKILILVILLSGCTTVSYQTVHENDVVEKYSMTTWFKSVDGLSVIRTPDLFGLKIDSTNTDKDAIQAVAEILKYYADPTE